MGPVEMDGLKAASLLYDIGLLGVPEAILSKEGGLSSDEFEHIKKHVNLSTELIEQMGLPSQATEIVRGHHERWNGGGYPHGLAGSEIPLGARILAVVDCFCALAGKAGLREAVGVVHSQAGISFDPAVVGVLLDRWCEFESSIAKAGWPEALSTMATARRENREMVKLYRHLGNSLSVNETLATLARDLKALVDYDGLTVYLERGGQFMPAYMADAGFEVDNEFGARVAESGAPILSETEERNGLRSVLAIPLHGAQCVVGVVALFRCRPAGFREDDLRVLTEIGTVVAAAIENAVKHQAATNSASTDYLTGLPNSRALFERLDDELARCRRSGGSLAVLVCDLDGFKQVNDRCGHLAGNQVLRAVARVLESNCREYDFVARIGGDEFVMVLPGLPARALKLKREKLLRAVEDAAEAACPGCGVTMSLGQARFNEDGKDAEALLAVADSRMYRDKNGSAQVSLVAAGCEVMAWPIRRVQ
jgi:diguanylate cyclase (GGDEF)-like protein